jgi:hypothetical protein
MKKIAAIAIAIALLQTTVAQAGTIIYTCTPPMMINDFIVWVQIPCVWLPLVIR